MSAMLSVCGLERQFETAAGPVHALRGADMTVRQGEFVMLTGPSGSGKSTFLSIVALLDRPTGGEHQFLGQTVHTLNTGSLARLRRDHIGMVFQSYHLLPRRTVLENILFRYRYQRHNRRVARKMAVASAERLGLGHRLDRPVYLLSGGEMQRTAIARAIVHQPSLLLADEPTGNLDAENSDNVLGIFRALNEDGLTIMMVTHNASLLGFATTSHRFSDGVLDPSGS